MTHKLEAPTGAELDWSQIYRARGDEVSEYRPIFTGDVFENVILSESADAKAKTLIIVQHPCAMRTNGSDLVENLLVAEIRKHSVLPPEKWVGYGKLMPLPDLYPTLGNNNRNQAAFFDKLLLVPSKNLVDRTACLSQGGVNLLLQRWVHHNSRVVVPTPDFDKVTSNVYDEADLIEEWCDERVSEERSLSEATTECVTWLREVGSDGVMRQRRLEDPQSRSAVRKNMRTALRNLR